MMNDFDDYTWSAAAPDLSAADDIQGGPDLFVDTCTAWGGDDAGELFAGDAADSPLSLPAPAFFPSAGAAEATKGDVSVPDLTGDGLDGPAHDFAVDTARSHQASTPSENLPEADTAATASANTNESSVHGNPSAWTINWFYQQIDGYCGPAVVGQIVAEYTGANITDPQYLMNRAVELGLVIDGDPSQGMTLSNIEILLEHQGVPATISTGSLDDVRTSLDDGHAVVAMVDSGEIWRPEGEDGEDNTADHVLVVAGIDDDRGVVILSDPGVPSGSQLEISIEQFENAWADSGRQLLVTDAPDTDLLDTAGRASAASHPTRTVVIDLAGEEKAQ